MKKIKFILFTVAGLLLASSGYSQQLSLKQITFSDSTHDGYPYWTKDSKHIIYGSGTSSSHFMMRIPAEGGSPIQLTDYFAQHGRLSPDESYLVFDGDYGKTIQICSANGGKPIRIVPESIPIHNSGMPCWSPTGDSIAFHSFGDIYIMELETGKASNIFQIENRLASSMVLDTRWKKILISCSRYGNKIP